MMKLFVLVLVALAAATDAVRVKRVKAGMRYKQHDPVHIDVNKVG